jgi:hypothetical protein
VAKAWQDPEEKKKFKPIIPKLWYGWIGKGTKNNWQLGNNFRNLLKRISKTKKTIKRLDINNLRLCLTSTCST